MMRPWDYCDLQMISQWTYKLLLFFLPIKKKRLNSNINLISCKGYWERLCSVKKSHCYITEPTSLKTTCLLVLPFWICYLLITKNNIFSRWPSHIDWLNITFNISNLLPSLHYIHSITGSLKTNFKPQVFALIAWSANVCSIQENTFFSLRGLFIYIFQSWAHSYFLSLINCTTKSQSKLTTSFMLRWVTLFCFSLTWNYLGSHDLKFTFCKCQRGRSNNQQALYPRLTA